MLYTNIIVKAIATKVLYMYNLHTYISVVIFLNALTKIFLIMESIKDTTEEKETTISSKINSNVLV